MVPFFNGRGDEIDLIFFQKSAPLRRLYVSDTSVSPSLLVKHAPSRVRTLLHAIYKRKKATKNGGSLCLWSGRRDSNTRHLGPKPSALPG